MDFGDYRKGKVWVKVGFGPDPDPDEDPRYQAAQFTARIAYAPGMLGDEDVEFLATLEHVRLMDLKPPAVPVAENRAQKRAREKAAARADATPPGQDDRPTLIDFMKRLIVDWDLTVDGKPLPVGEDAFRQMELGLRLEIVTAIMKDYLERPRLGSLSKLLSEGTTESGPITLPLSSRLNSTETESSPGITSVTPNGAVVRSGVGGSGT